VAQVQKIDSLKKWLHQHPQADTLRVNNLIELAYIYRQIKPDTTFILAQQAQKIAEEIKYLKGKAWALNRIAGGYWMKAQYPASLKFALKSLKIFETIADKRGIAESYNSLANIYNMENQYPKALQYYASSIKIYQELGENFLIARAYGNIGRTYYMHKRYDDALSNLQKVLNLPEAQREKTTYATVLNTTGDVYQAQVKYDLALQTYRKALQISEELQNSRIITYSTRGLSEIYQKKGDISQSNQFAERTLKLSKEIKYTENVKNAALILSTNYRQAGDYKQALDYYLEFEVAKDSMFNADKEREIRRLVENYTIEEKEDQIKLLKTEQNVQQTRVYALIIVVVLVAILSFILYRGYAIKQKINRLLTLQRNRLTEQNAEINQQREEILSQSEMLQQANDLKDRLFSIIAHDLRSPFNSLLMIIQYLDNQVFTPQELKQLKDKLYANITSLSEMLNNLLLWANQQMHGEISGKKMIDIQHFIQKNLKVFEIPAAEKNIVLQNEASDQVLAYGYADQIDSVLRNLINNAIKFTHSEGIIVVAAHQQAHEILVSVRDTGVGIPSDKINQIFTNHSKISSLGTAKEIGSGLGLMLCRDFVENNGGKIWVESQAGIGTTFFFTLPIFENNLANVVEARELS
jgi:signal transduction histidine kinase